jgi:hypothetical protein
VDNDDDAAFPKLGAPARRALSAAGVAEPGRSTLQTLRRTILEIVPDAEK